MGVDQCFSGFALVLILFVAVVTFDPCFTLFPKESVTRELKRLDGVWDFRICPQDDQDVGFREQWYKRKLSKSGEVIPMPVPCSFNDITQNKTIRDYLGWAWYGTSFHVPQRWSMGQRVVLWFGSAHYIAYVYLNGVSVLNHTGGHLPFEADVTKFIRYSDINVLTVALNNTLSQDTIPQGSKTFKDKPYPPGFYSQSTNFDFFNYAGIHRSVILYTTPFCYVEDITVITDTKGTTGYVKFSVVTSSSYLKQANGNSAVCSITVLDKQENVVTAYQGCNGTLTIHNACFWWPYTMHPDPGYLYTLKVEILYNNMTDVYEQRFGIRSVSTDKTSFMINEKPFYFVGFGKHEDSDIRGKGVDLPLIIKDFNLIKWIGANSFRTSHYPYADEIMDQADQQGVVVIDECPAVGLQSFATGLLQKHQEVVRELIQRDKNRPSVVAWSLANEPKSSLKDADQYFKKLVSYARTLDSTRPLTAAINANPATDYLGKYLDLIMINRYHSWYSDTGSTEVILPLLVNDIVTAFNIYQKPIMVSEYGSDTVAGLHMDPPFVFTEDYQTELMVQHHLAFDVLKHKNFFVGEHIWNFADFMTLQQITRVVGNKKGIFTRDRQPKAAAKLLRCRYHIVANRSIHGSAAYCPYDGKVSNLSYKP